MQVPYRERQEEEPGGDPHATYAYVAADAAAKAARTELGAEVGCCMMKGACPEAAATRTAR